MDVSYSRVSKYKDLREGLKDEAGINREEIKEEVKEVVNDDDDFLSFLKTDEREGNVEDTLTEAKTFEQLRQESSKEIDKALKSAKNSVGKEEQYNTRMDILNKIREPEANKIKIDSMDQYKTEQFAKGMFINQEEKEPEVEKPPLPKMTLMERLQMMSPKEDAKKAQEILEKQTLEPIEEEVEEVEEETNIPAVNLEEQSLEEMISNIKEKDQKEVAKAINEGKVTKYDFTTNPIIEEENEKEDKTAKVLNYVIIVLVIILIGLFGMVIYQSFF